MVDGNNIVRVIQEAASGQPARIPVDATAVFTKFPGPVSELQLSRDGTRAAMGQLPEFQQAQRRVANGTVVDHTEPAYVLGSDPVLNTTLVGRLSGPSFSRTSSTTWFSVSVFPS